MVPARCERRLPERTALTGAPQSRETAWAPLAVPAIQQIQRALRKIAHSAHASCSHFADCHCCELPLVVVAAAFEKQQLASTSRQQPLPLPQRCHHGAKRLASRLERTLCAQPSGRLAAPPPPLRSARQPQTLAARAAGRPPLAAARSSSRRALTSSA